MGYRFKPEEIPPHILAWLEEQQKLYPPSRWHKGPRYTPGKYVVGSEVLPLTLGSYPKTEARGFQGMSDYLNLRGENEPGGGRGLLQMPIDLQPRKEARLWFERKLSKKRIVEECRQTFKISWPDCLLISDSMRGVLEAHDAIPQGHLLRLPVYRGDDPEQVTTVTLFDPPIGPPIVDIFQTETKWRWSEDVGCWDVIEANRFEKESILPGVELKIARDPFSPTRIFIDKSLLWALRDAGVENLIYMDIYAMRAYNPPT